MSKSGTVVILSIIIFTLPWVGFELWKMLPSKINVDTVRHIVNALFGISAGILFFKKEIKLIILPVLLLIFISSNIIWSINRFNTSKQDLQSGAIEYPQSIPACEKEANFENLWDYMSNGCHFIAEELTRSIIDRVLILTIVLLLTRMLLKLIRVKRNTQKDPN